MKLSTFLIKILSQSNTLIGKSVIVLLVFICSSAMASAKTFTVCNQTSEPLWFALSFITTRCTGMNIASARCFKYNTFWNTQGWWQVASNGCYDISLPPTLNLELSKSIYLSAYNNHGQITDSTFTTSRGNRPILPLCTVTNLDINFSIEYMFERQNTSINNCQDWIRWNTGFDTYSYFVEIEEALDYDHFTFTFN